MQICAFVKRTCVLLFRQRTAVFHPCPACVLEWVVIGYQARTQVCWIDYWLSRVVFVTLAYHLRESQIVYRSFMPRKRGADSSVAAMRWCEWIYVEHQHFVLLQNYRGHVLCTLISASCKPILKQVLLRTPAKCCRLHRSRRCSGSTSTSSF